MTPDEAASVFRVIDSWLALIDARGAQPGKPAQAGLIALCREHPEAAARFPRVVAATGVSLASFACADREPETWITSREAARITGLTPNGVRDAVRQGRLKAKKHGGLWAVDEREAARYAESHAAGR